MASSFLKFFFCWAAGLLPPFFHTLLESKSTSGLEGMQAKKLPHLGSHVTRKLPLDNPSNFYPSGSWSLCPHMCTVLAEQYSGLEGMKAKKSHNWEAILHENCYRNPGQPTPLYLRDYTQLKGPGCCLRGAYLHTQLVDYLLHAGLLGGFCCCFFIFLFLKPLVSLSH